MCTNPRAIFAASVLLLATACTAGSPTASSTAPAGPRLDAGPGFGSGNVVASSGSTFGSGYAVTGAENGSAAADSVSAAAQGPGFGSGN
jgi:hypothetical protein